MPYAMELALDDEAGAVVRGLWQRVADAGFPFMACSGAHPHVSLALWEHVDRDAMEAGLRRFAARCPVVDVAFPAVEMFASTGVVFLALAPSAPLREVQARCHAMLAALGRDPWAQYAPAAWVPHCTLGMDLGKDVERVAALVRAAFVPLRGRLVRAELVEFRPVRHLLAAPLGAGAPPDGTPSTSCTRHPGSA
jgi:2'-5' RNA ligase